MSDADSDQDTNVGSFGGNRIVISHPMGVGNSDGGSMSDSELETKFTQWMEKVV